MERENKIPIHRQIQKYRVRVGRELNEEKEENIQFKVKITIERASWSKIKITFKHRPHLSIYILKIMLYSLLKPLFIRTTSIYTPLLESLLESLATQLELSVVRTNFLMFNTHFIIIVLRIFFFFFRFLYFCCYYI